MGAVVDLSSLEAKTSRRELVVSTRAHARVIIFIVLGFLLLYLFCSVSDLFIVEFEIDSCFCVCSI
jgi:hypothetical protein